MNENSQQEQGRPEVAMSPAKKSDFLHRMVLMDSIAILLVLMLAGIWFAAEALLLVFACVLFAILLYELSVAVQRRLHV